MTCWADLAPCISATYDIDPTVFYLDRVDDGTWFGLAIRRTKELQASNDLLSEYCRRSGHVVTTPSTFAYWPHLTLGKWCLEPGNLLHVSSLGPHRVVGYPALAKIGTWGEVIPPVLASP